MTHAAVQKIRKGKLTVGGWLTIGDTSVAEILGQSGFDWMAIDMEHSVIDFSQMQGLMQAIELGGGLPLVRVTSNQPDYIKRAMDAGAGGVIVPMINTVADAEKAVASVKYPPVGRRGVGLARAQGYGMGFDRYQRANNKDSLVIIQIENREALDEIDEIFSVPGVDAYMIGPYDLSSSYGVPGRFDHPKVQQALDTIWKAGKRNNLTAGTHVVYPDPKEAKKQIRKGYRFIAYGNDMLFLATKSRDGLATIRGKKK